jgi:23S rRNA (guanosine2251-2'-O)-methyltransferase
MQVIILENIRSAYNVGNVLRTADALGRNVWIVGYTPSPLDHPKVRKTSLGAEENVHLQQFDFTLQAIEHAKHLGMQVIAAEITEHADSLTTFSPLHSDIAVIFGNEKEGILESTL